jgi:hypothetical protein
LYQLLGCKRPYLLSINAGGYNVRQDDGVTAGEAWLHGHIDKLRLFEWVLAVPGRIYVSGFLSLDFLPLLWFVSGNGDMEEGGHIA